MVITLISVLPICPLCQPEETEANEYVCPMYVRCAASALVVIASAAYAQEIPLDGASILIENSTFIRKAYGNDSPMLTFTLVNRTGKRWRRCDLHFDIEGVCNGQARQCARG